METNAVAELEKVIPHVHNGIDAPPVNYNDLENRPPAPTSAINLPLYFPVFQGLIGGDFLSYTPAISNDTKRMFWKGATTKLFVGVNRLGSEVGTFLKLAGNRTTTINGNGVSCYVSAADSFLLCKRSDLSTDNVNIYSYNNDDLFSSEQLLTVSGQALNAVWDISTDGTYVYIADRVANKTLTGTIAASGSTAITGTSTLFVTELSVGDLVLVDGTLRTVLSIADNTHLAVDFNAGTFSGVALKRADFRFRKYSLSGTTLTHVSSVDPNFGKYILSLQVSGEIEHLHLLNADPSISASAKLYKYTGFSATLEDSQQFDQDVTNEVLQGLFRLSNGALAMLYRFPNTGLLVALDVSL